MVAKRKRLRTKGFEMKVSYFYLKFILENKKPNAKYM